MLLISADPASIRQLANSPLQINIMVTLLVMTFADITLALPVLTD